MEEEIKLACHSLREQMITWRRDFHQYPELSFQEFQTTEKISTFLNQLGLKVKKGEQGIGVVADLEGALPGPRVALRADIDALPINEESNKEYASRNQGVMHACGHDGHTAMLMAAAQILSQRKLTLKGKVRFIFQAAEELAPGGALKMIKEGFLEDVDYIYGLHLWSGFATGTFKTVSGPMMASSDKFTITLQGKGGHAGLPHEATDTVLAASQLVVNAQHIISRRIDPLQSGVVTFGKIKAGSNFNVIADKAELEGTVRALNEKERALIQESLEQTVKHTCGMYGVDYQLNYKKGYPAVVNHPVETELLMSAAEEIFGADGVETMLPIMAGEDFSYYLQKVPGAFCLVGAGNEQKGIIYPHHHPRFDIDEDALPLGAELLCRIALKHLG